MGPETNTSADNLLKHKFCRRGILSKCTFIIVVQKEFNGILKRSHTPIAAAVKSIQSCLTLCDTTDSSPPCSTDPGILQARTLEWVAIPSPILPLNGIYLRNARMFKHTNINKYDTSH